MQVCQKDQSKYNFAMSSKRRSNTYFSEQGKKEEKMSKEKSVQVSREEETQEVIFNFSMKEEKRARVRETVKCI